MSEAGRHVDGSAIRRLRLRYAGVCTECGAQLAVGTPALYDPAARTVRCVECQPPVTVEDPVASGSAGASARREFERRHARREERVRAAHPRLGGLILAVSDDPQSTRAWAVGAKGEETLGRRLDGSAGPSVRVLHDRRIPPTRANIDHLVVCPSGVLVVDAKRYTGRPHLKVEGGFLVPRTEKLMVGSRDGSKLVDGVLKQVGLVRSALRDGEVVVRGFLCFLDADWPLLGGAVTTRGVMALWPRKLVGLIAEPGPLTADDVRGLHSRLAQAFPVA